MAWKEGQGLESRHRIVKHDAKFNTPHTPYFCPLFLSHGDATGSVSNVRGGRR